ncbi:hypothetical protein [Chitinophaga sp. HK235]|uniref:hypothetical protein n=1 Tax=Chitinophaga sp. HK235 TaxID=2952571 RepID=UPI001BA76719|nr:hypothetical protein [Chitinophaga sp. HK235]
MADLKKQNKEIFKIVWLPGEHEIIFNAKTESPLSLKSPLYELLNQYLDIDKWKIQYNQLYLDWLDGNSESIYNINDQINLSIIDALIKLNKILDQQAIYYWFDIDRTFTEGFTWKYCPISGEELICLGSGYPEKNAFISPRYPLIFPDYEE